MGALTVTAFGVSVALVSAVSIFYFLYNMRRAGENINRSAATAAIMALSALLLSRACYAILNFDYLADSLDQPLAVLRFWEGGFSYWGAVYGALFAFYFRSLRSKNSKLQAYALPALLLFAALLRVPELFSTVGRGAPVESEGLLAVFPFAIPDSGESPCAAISVFELAAGLIAFGASLLLTKRGANKYAMRLPLAFYCLADVLLQSLRQDESGYMMAGFVRIEQVLAMVLVGLIFIGSVIGAAKQNKKAWLKLLSCSIVSAAAIAAGILCEYALDAGNEPAKVYLVMGAAMLAFLVSCIIVSLGIPKDEKDCAKQDGAR